MAKAPLFSTYRQGENRVTSSVLAVLERVDLALVERLLGAASGESSVEMVRFVNQPGGGEGSVPDASISASFHYLFEVKTVRGAISSDQLKRHLAQLNRSAEIQRLYVLTPDAEPPPEVEEIGDDRLVWLSFAGLDQAIGDLLGDRDAMVSEREQFLLRELQRLFEEDELLAPAEDTVVVAARNAYPEYLRLSAYLC